MTLFGITRNGLLSLGFSVAALWGCLTTEHVFTRRADLDRSASLRTVKRLREYQERHGGGDVSPASRPMPRLGNRYPSAA